jgi:hypothetical protein
MALDRHDQSHHQVDSEPSTPLIRPFRSSIMTTDKALHTSSAEVTPTMSYDPNKPDRAYDRDLEDDKALSGHHFTVQGNAASNVPPIHDPLIAGVAKISTFRQVYSSKKLVWSFWIAFAFWAFAIALSQDTTFVCKSSIPLAGSPTPLNVYQTS